MEVVQVRSRQFQCGVDNQIPIYCWEPDSESPIRGLIQLVHGSCEHAGRYEHFAHFLTEQGYVVYANDLRGHGRSVTALEDLGYFGERGGWNAMVAELYEVTLLAKEEYPNLGLVMLGHSMGSFLARQYACTFGGGLKGLVLSGTAHHPRGLLHMGHTLANLSIMKNGSKHRSKLLFNLSYASFNRRFHPARTKLDWLTRDEEVVDRFLADKYCGFVFTASGFRDMFEGLLFITDRAWINQTPRTLPILLLSGTNDPVGDYGRMVKRAYHEYRNAGIPKVRMKLYEGMRHEILNEIGKEDVYREIADWVNQCLGE
ncbi:MAG: lysophospholipase [Gorillibacterium sp.]|nr:lysophospholipase [Gorillibacterium sp.]